MAGTKVKLETTKGDIIVELEDAKAPASVKNFLSYVDAGFYDKTVFHRVIPGFMIQGGGFAPGLAKKATQASIQNEANNGLKNLKYSLSMARTTDPHSASSQFFINLKDNDFLDHLHETQEGWGYAVFGRVVEGQDVVEALGSVTTGSQGQHQDVPVDEVGINSAVKL